MPTYPAPLSLLIFFLFFRGVVYHILPGCDPVGCTDIPYHTVLHPKSSHQAAMNMKNMDIQKWTPKDTLKIPISLKKHEETKPIFNKDHSWGNKVLCTTPKNHMSQKRNYFNRKYIFQPSCFRDMLVFRGVQDVSDLGRFKVSCFRTDFLFIFKKS